MKVSQLAKAANVTAETIRYYTRKGLLTPTHNIENGYAQYNNHHLQRLKFIRQARALGFSLKEIETILANAQNSQSPCPFVRDSLTTKISQVKQQIIDLQQHLVMLKEVYDDWQEKENGMPNGESICCLIESWSDKHKSG